MSGTMTEEQDDDLDVLQDLLETAKKYEALEQDEPDEATEFSQTAKRDSAEEEHFIPCDSGAVTIKDDLALDEKLEDIKVPEWRQPWNRDLLLENRDGKGLKQIIELTVKSYQGVTSGLFDKFGTATFASGATYQGAYGVNRCSDGIGRLAFPDGTTFDGEFDQGEIGKRGVYHWSDGCVYEGGLREGIRNGYGRYFDASSGSFYMGEWMCSLMHGYGKMIYFGDESNCYRGIWHGGMPWGQGVRQWASGNFYEGTWARGLPHGKGTKFWKSCNALYEGEFSHGKPRGYGLLLWLSRQPPNSGSVNQRYFYGMFKDGVANGAGTYTQLNGTQYVGQWKNGKKNGKVFLANGFVVECCFADGVLFEPMPKFLLKTSSNKYYACPVPGPSIQQIDHSPFHYNSETAALVLPGTVYYLSEMFGLPEATIQAEMKGLGTVFGSYMEVLVDIYNAYDRLMAETACDNIYTLRAFQYWQFLIDVAVDRTNNGCDVQQRLFYLIRTIEQSFNKASRFDVFCHPYQPIKPSEFFDRIAIVSYIVEREKQHSSYVRLKTADKKDEEDKWPFKKTWDVPGQPLKNMIERRILRNAGLFHSCIFDDPKKCPVIFRYISRLFRIYRYLHEFYGGQMEKMPEGLTLDMLTTGLRDIQMLSEPGVTYTQLLTIFEEFYPEIRLRKGGFLLGLPVTFLEFLELIVEIALVYDGPNKSPTEAKKPIPRPRQSYRGKIVQAVDSILLAKEKSPNLTKEPEQNDLDFDVSFFRLLRETDVEPRAGGPSDDPVLKRKIQERTEFLSGGTLPGSNGVDDWEDEDDAASCPVRNRKHPRTCPFESAPDYEIPPESVPAGYEFAGYCIGYPSRSSVGIDAGKAPDSGNVTGFTRHLPKTLADVPSMDAYADVFGGVERGSFTLSLLPEWENKVASFFEEVLFPRIILFKNTNDYLISHGLAQPLGDVDDADSIVDDSIADAFLDQEKRQPEPSEKDALGDTPLSNAAPKTRNIGGGDQAKPDHREQRSLKSDVYRKYLHVARAKPGKKVSWSSRT